MTKWRQICYQKNEKTYERIISPEIFDTVLNQAWELLRAGEDIIISGKDNEYIVARKKSDGITYTTRFEKIEEEELTTIGFSIYQLPREHDNKFMNYKWAMNHGGINYREYETVYTGDIDVADTDTLLEQIYTKFNTDHPADFYGHSLSVSDLVVIENTGTYFCDSIGWKKLN